MTDLDERPDELQRFVASMRRQRVWYLVAIAVVAVIAVAVTVVVWFSSEIAHVHLRTAKSAPPTVPLGSPPTAPTAKWGSGDKTAIGAPFDDGTVVTYSTHTVTGRNALTGTADWTYRRTDRTACQVAQVQGKTIAVYTDADGNCDEVSTFETGTGKRAWTRTLDENGLTLSGHPTFIASTDTLYAWTADFVYAIDPSSGYDRWTYSIGDGCTLTTVVPGSAGVLMNAHCTDGDQLLMRDRSAGSDDKQQTDDKKNQILWRLKNTSTVAVAADSIVAALDPTTRQLVTYEPAKGTVRAHLTLTPNPSATSPVQHVAANQAELIWIAGTAYAIDSTGTQEWSGPFAAPPTLTPPDGSPVTPDLSSARILVPTPSGVAALDGASGKVTTQYAVPPPEPGGQVYPVGNGFLVAGPSTAYYA